MWISNICDPKSLNRWAAHNIREFAYVTCFYNCILNQFFCMLTKRGFETLHTKSAHMKSFKSWTRDIGFIRSIFIVNLRKIYQHTYRHFYLVCYYMPCADFYKTNLYCIERPMNNHIPYTPFNYMSNSQLTVKIKTELSFCYPWGYLQKVVKNWRPALHTAKIQVGGFGRIMMSSE